MYGIRCEDEYIRGLVRAVYDCEVTRAILERAKFRNTQYENPKILVKWGEDVKSRVETGVIELALSWKAARGGFCRLVQGLVFELVNMTNLHRFRALNRLAQAVSPTGGPLISEEEFVEANERIEFEARKAVIAGFEACGEAWGCTECLYDLAAKNMTFESWFRLALDPVHKYDLMKKYYLLRANGDPTVYKRLLLDRARRRGDIGQDEYEREIASLPSSSSSASTSGGGSG